MKKVKIKKPVIYSMCIAVSALLLGGLWYIDTSQKSLNKDQDEDLNYVSRLFDDNVISVVSTASTIIRPYNNEQIKALNNFYDYQSDEKAQQNAIINYDTTYIQNNGVSYGGINDTFDVLAALDGTVSSIKDDNLLGKVVTITHSNGITTVYQSLSEVTVKENDQVVQGTVIGKAGESNINKDLGNHVSFEIMKDGKYLNPENCYETSIDKLND